jgi:rRNA-processing protein FCF1
MSLSLLIAFAVQVDTADELSSLLERAKPTNSKAVRLAALKKMKEVGKNDAKRTSESLAAYAREDDTEIRNAAVVAIGLSAIDRIACPLPIITAFNDDDATIRTNATSVAGLFKQFPKEAIPLLYAAAKSQHTGIRSSVPFLLGKAVGKTSKVLKTLRTMFADSEWTVRNNAHVTHFQLTNNMVILVPHLLRTTADRKKRTEPETNEQRQKRQFQEFCSLSVTIQVYEHSRLRPDDLAKALAANLSHAEPAIRQCALRHLRAMCIGSKTTFRAVNRLKLHKRLETISEKDENEKARFWAAWVRDILKEGPPKTAPEMLKPYAVLPIPTTPAK